MKISLSFKLTNLKADVYYINCIIGVILLMLYRSRAKNMVLMGYLGGKEMLSNSQKSLSQRLTLEVLLTSLYHFCPYFLFFVSSCVLLHCCVYWFSATNCIIT